MSSEFRFKIFKEYHDHLNWEKHLEYIRSNPDFEKKRRKEFSDVYNFLKKELGKDYLKNCYRDGRNRVNHWLCNSQNNYRELYWLSEALSFFKLKDCNYETGLLGRLRSNEECNRQGLPFLLVGDSLRKAGFEVIFEPEVPFKKKPDLKIIIPETSEVIYGEISQLNDSLAIETSSNTYHDLFEFFHFKTPFVNFSAKIHKTAIESEIKKIGELILETKERASKERDFIIVEKEETFGVLEFAVAHEDKIKELEEWKKKKQFRGINELLGLPLNFDYTYRLRSKILDEAKQLPPNFPGIIYVTLPAVYFLFGALNLSDLIDSVKEELKKFPHVIGIFMYSHLGNINKPEKEIFELNYFERKMINENIQQDVLFVINNEFNTENGEFVNMLYKFYSSFGYFFV